MRRLVLFEKTYDGESMADIFRDVSEAVDSDFTPEIKELPTDQYGFVEGSFRVMIEWIPPGGGRPLFIEVARDKDFIKWQCDSCGGFNHFEPGVRPWCKQCGEGR